MLHGGYEFGSRDFSGLEIERSEDASFVTPGAPANIFAAPSASLCVGGRRLQPPLRPGPAPRQQGLRPRPAHARGTLVLRPLLHLRQVGLRGLGLRPPVRPLHLVHGGGRLHPQREVERLRLLHLGRQPGLPPRPAERLHHLREPPGRLDLERGRQDQLDRGGSDDHASSPRSGRSTSSRAGRRSTGTTISSRPTGGAPAVGRVSVGGIKDIPNFDDTTLTSVSAELKYRLRRWGLALGGLVRALSSGRLGDGGPQQLHPQPVLPERGQRELSGGVGIRPGFLHLVTPGGEVQEPCLSIRSSP